jgi:hypothetical protein
MTVKIFITSPLGHCYKFIYIIDPLGNKKVRDIFYSCAKNIYHVPVFIVPYSTMTINYSRNFYRIGHSGQCELKLQCGASFKVVSLFSSSLHCVVLENNARSLHCVVQDYV